MKKLEDESINMILTDPPYGINFKSARQTYQKHIVNDGFEEWQALLPSWLKEMARILKPTGVCCCCCCGGGKTPVTAIFTLEFIKHFNLIQTVIWDKKTIGLGWRYRPGYETVIVGSKDKTNYEWHTEAKNVSNIVKYNNIIPGRNTHPTVKPVPLMSHFIQLHSKPGDTILDPFLGSGTTAVAAKSLGRRYVGIEIDPNYIKIAERRLRQGVLAL